LKKLPLLLKSQKL